MLLVTLKRLLTNSLKRIKSLLNPKLNDYVEQFLWKYKHIIIPKRMKDFGEHRGIRREQLVNLIKSKKEFKNLLELGCGNGINIEILSKEIKNSQFHGIDINKKVIIENQKRAIRNNNCKFYFMNINNMNLFKTNSFDYVLTDSVLIYHSPEKVLKILNELKRIASKGIILREQCSEKTKYLDHWIHNYRKLIKEIGIQNYKFLKTYGQEGLWNQYGYIIDIEL
tara:strand:+ start:61 stop:732 length:672 start_codon:yes stop_codon:yes gene_type:complete